MKIQDTKIRFLLLVLTLCFSALAAAAQTTVFTYQGRFVDATLPQPTNGSYEMQFKLFNAAQNGAQIGGTQTVPTVQVVNGIFTVQLDAENSFSGADLFIEIGVRPAGSSAALTVLAPRQQVTSAPYAVQSRNALTALTAVNADKLGNLPANNYTQTNDTRLSDDRNPLAGSANYIQNQNTAAQPGGFNVAGSGAVGAFFSAGSVSTITNYKIGGTIVFSTPNQTSIAIGQLANHNVVSGNNVFFGYKAGQVSNGFSQANTFIGSESGELNTSGGNNVFVGKDAGFFNTSGSFNAFFGSGAGKSNQTADANAFFGYESGLINTTGTRNAFFGFQAGRGSQTVNDNSFFGYQAGTVTTGGGNAFFGSKSGVVNSTGVSNTFVGSSAGVSNTTGFENTFVGNNAGSNSSSGSKNTVIGSGSFLAGSNNTVVGNNTTTIGSNNTVIGFQAVINSGALHSTVIGADAITNKSNTILLGTNADTVEVPNLLTSKNITVSSKVDAFTVDAGLGIFDAIKLNNTPFGDKPLCLKTTTKEIGVCPTSFNIQPDKSAVSLTNTVKEQQTQIELQAEQIKAQQEQIEQLKQIVCAMNPAAGICGK